MPPPDTGEHGLSSLCTTLTISPSLPLSSYSLFSSVTADSAKRSPSADDDDHPPPKRPRTGDVVPDIDPLPSE